MHIQKLFVIIAFNETLLAKAVSLLAFVPVVGSKLEQPFKTFLEKQKNKFHRKPGTGPDTQVSRASYCLFILLNYFILCIRAIYVQNTLFVFYLSSTVNPFRLQDGGNLLAWIFEKLILLMITYFILSIVNSFAQNYHKRIHKHARDKKLAQDWCRDQPVIHVWNDTKCVTCTCGLVEDWLIEIKSWNS